MMKICKKCNEEKTLDKFYLEKNNKYSLWCKECQLKKAKIYYNNNKKSYADYKYNKVKWFYDYKKTLNCSECNIKNYIVLDFHHIDPKDKKFGLDNENIAKRKKEDILKEIEKCIVLCANCHRIKHSSNLIKYYGS